VQPVDAVHREPGDRDHRQGDGDAAGHMLAPPHAAGTFVMGFVESGGIANMDKSALSSGW
jgi:hypothetical protein